ncbi:putative allantoate permease [Flagelloscypha sp. PMI_526]|nr:putative allantoate permease [Flagelloscypha sp. PMI_526]
MSHTPSDDIKADESRVEKSDISEVEDKGAAVLGGDRIVVTEEDSKRICRKIDTRLLTLLSWVYFLQILDKVIIGYAAVFGLKTDTGLVGDQYSSVGAIGYWAQMGAQPIGAYVLVKFPVRVIMPVIVFFWGCALCGMAGSHNFTGLMISRFFLGWFEALCLPLFSLITSQWYRRVEQPMRVATWYGTNGVASMLGSLLAWALSFIVTDKMHNYQILFTLTGGVTCITGISLWFLLDNGPADARFLSPEDRLKAVERLRSNNTGLGGNTTFKWRQVFELFTEFKGLMWFGMTLLVNVGASTSTVFGPLILKGLLKFDARTTMLLNIPFGALQLAIIFFASWVAGRYKLRSAIFAAAMVPVVAGCAILFAVPRDLKYKGALLTGYYFLSFLYGANPLIVSWIISNTGGASKKAASMALYNFASSMAHVFSPYIFKAEDEPEYIPGLRIVMIIFCVLIGLVGLTAANLFWLNKQKEKQRVANGKPAKLKDLSMAHHFDNTDNVDDKKLGENAFLDMTDRENDEFIYVL